jgi:hypothetical protein
MLVLLILLCLITLHTRTYFTSMSNPLVGAKNCSNMGKEGWGWRPVTPTGGVDYLGRWEQKLFLWTIPDQYIEIDNGSGKKNSWTLFLLVRWLYIKLCVIHVSWRRTLYWFSQILMVRWLRLNEAMIFSLRTHCYSEMLYDTSSKLAINNSIILRNGSQ